MLIAQLCPTLCEPMDYSPPGSSVHGILQARILEWIARLFSRESSWPRDGTQVSHIAGRLITVWATWEALGKLKMLIAQLCPTLWEPVDYSPPASAVREILHARILEWVAMPSSRGSSWPMNAKESGSVALQEDSLLSEPPGKCIYINKTESLCCIPETKITLYINYTSIKKWNKIKCDFLPHIISKNNFRWPVDLKGEGKKIKLLESNRGCSVPYSHQFRVVKYTLKKTQKY